MATKLTNNQLIALRKSIMGVSALQSSQLKTPIVINAKLSYALRKNVRLIDSALVDYNNSRSERIKKHSDGGKINLDTTEKMLGPDGKPTDVDNPEYTPEVRVAREACVKEINELLEIGVEVPLHKVKEADFNLDKNNIPFNVLLDIEAMIEDEAPAAPAPAAEKAATPAK